MHMFLPKLLCDMLLQEQHMDTSALVQQALQGRLHVMDDERFVPVGWWTSSHSFGVEARKLTSRPGDLSARGHGINRAASNGRATCCLYAGGFRVQALPASSNYICR